MKLEFHVSLAHPRSLAGHRTAANGPITQNDDLYLFHLSQLPSLSHSRGSPLGAQLYLHATSVNFSPHAPIRLPALVCDLGAGLFTTHPRPHSLNLAIQFLALS